MPNGQGQARQPANIARITLLIDGESVPVVSLSGSESLSAPFHFKLEVLVDRFNTLPRMMGAEARLAFTGDDGTTREVAGIVASYEDVGLAPDGRIRAIVHFVSHIDQMRHYRDTRVILGHSIPDIVRATCERNGIPATRLRFDLSRSYRPRPYVLQANETDLEFLQRLLARAGITFYSLADDDGELIVFTDHNANCPYLSRPVLRYLPQTGQPQGLGGQAHVGVHGLAVTHRLVSRRHGVHDYNEDTPASTLHCQADCTAPGNAARATTVVRHGLGSRAIEETDQLARQLAEHAAVTAFDITAESNVIDMAAGHIFSLDGGDFDPACAGDMLITAVTHRASQQAGLQLGDEDVAYRATATCLPRETPYRPAIPPHPDLPLTFTARIESEGRYAHLDEQGRYVLRGLFDLGAAPHTRASVPLRRLAPHGGLPHGGTVGQHTPLHDGDEVLLACLNGDPDRPMIVGTLPNPARTSPVTSSNPAQNRLRTAGDNELCLDDEIDKEAITLRTYAGHNILHLDANAMGHKIRLAAEHGAMALFAKKTLHRESGDTLTERVGGDRTVVVENRHATTTKNKEIHHQAATDHRLKAHDFIKTDSGKNTEMQAGKHLKIDAADNAKITIQGPNGLHVTVDNNNVTLDAANDIRITGQGGGAITFEQSGGGFKIDTAGNVHLYGNRISLGGAGGVTFNGNVNYQIGGPSIPGTASVTAPLTARIIDTLEDPDAPKVYNLAWEAHRVPVGQPVRAGFSVRNFKGGETATVTVREIDLDQNETVLDTLTVLLSDGTGHIAVEWRARDGSDPAACEHDGPVAACTYVFDCEVDGVPASDTPEPLLLTTRLEVQLRNPQGQPLQETPVRELTLRAADGQVHHAPIKNGAAEFRDVPVGSVEVAPDARKTTGYILATAPLPTPGEGPPGNLRPLPRYVHGGPWQPANDPNFNGNKPDGGGWGKWLWKLGRAVGVITGVMTVDASRTAETEWEGEDGYSYKYTSADFGLSIYKNGKQVAKYDVREAGAGFQPANQIPIVGVIDENGKVTPVSRQDDIAYRTYLANGGKESFTEWVSAGRPGDPDSIPPSQQAWRKPKLTQDGRVIPYGKTAADAKRVQMPKGAVPGKSFSKNGFTIQYDENGFPIFDSLFDIYLDDSLLNNRDPNSHFRAANEALANALRNNPSLAKEMGLSDIQKAHILKGPPYSTVPPPSLTWHHHQDIGRMQLVDRQIHSTFKPHTGGMSIWGGGYK